MATAAAADCIGPYRAIRQIGAGGMGEVFLAHDEELGRNIAIKLLPAHLASDAEHLGRLRHEARSASSLNHPNIVTIYEIGRDDSQRAFMAMEYVDGQTLREALRGGALPVRKALQIATQIADGLAAAHKRGLVHRDLKPENIMLTTDGVVKILDFGLARSRELREDGNVSEPGMLVGTYSYMSPEQARAGEIDYRSDQFSFGSILYEMLAGRRAFDGASGVETLFLVVRDEPAPLSVVAPQVPAPLRWIVDRCLSKDPEDRYVATRDLARELQYLRDHFSEAGAAAPVREKDDLGTRLRKRWPAAAAVVLALAAGSLITAWARRPEPRAITSERYLTYSGHDYSPSVSPGGKLIAFASARDGVQRIWVKQVADGSEVALTEGIDDFPRFAPDGANIIYIRADPAVRRGSLWRVPAVGGEARRLLDDVSSADFSRDGTRIAFTRNVLQAGGTPISALWIANADGSNPRELARVDVGALHPRWSPDDSRIAVVTTRGGRVMQSLTIYDVATGKARELATPPKAGEVSTVVWREDGRKVVYVRAESVEVVVGGSAKVIQHDIDTDQTEVIGWTSHNGLMLDQLPGGKLVFDVRSPRDNLREIGIAGGGTEKWVTRGNSSDRQPVYAPDGKSLLFSSNRSGNLDLWIAASDGTVRRVTDDASEDWDPAFTADGKKIIWSSGRSGNLEIWIANADGSGAMQISRDGADAENPTATPDGRWIVYNSFNQQKPGIWKVRPDGTQATHLVKARTALPEVSPDGQYVAYLADGRTPRANIRIARLADGKDMGFSIPMRQFRRTSAILGRTRWMPDGKAIAFLAQNEEGVNGVFLQDFVPGRDTTATRRPLGGFDRERATESFGIAPDGKTMTVAGWEQLFSLFSIEGLPISKEKES